MGHEIVYCCRCQIQLRGKDFEKGSAFHLEGQVCCAGCLPQLTTLSGPSLLELQKQIAAAKGDAPKKVAEAHPAPSVGSTPHLPRHGAHSERSSPAALLGILAVAGVLGLVLVLFLADESGSRAARRDLPTASPIVLPGTGGMPAPPPDRPPPPGESPLRKARDYVRSNPSDFAGQIDLYERALSDLRGAAGLEEARRELDSLQKTARERIAAELGTLDPRTKEACAKEQFEQALEMIEETRRRLSAPDWTTPLNQRADDVRRQASGIFAGIKQEALAAQRRGAAEQVKAVQDRVARWGLQALTLDLGKSLAEAVIAPDSKVPAVSPEVSAFAKNWEAALQLAPSRDYAALIAELKRAGEGLREEGLRKSAAEDQELLRQASLAFKEAQLSIAKGAKGQTISLQFINAAGSVEQADGALLRLDPYRIELKRSSGESLVLPLGELRMGGLAALLKAAKGALPPAEARSLALLCLLEGDPQTARSLVEGKESALPERFWTYAQARAEAPLNPREQEARAAFYSAERGYEDPSTTAESAQKQAALLKSHEDTAFVRRNRDFIQLRSQGGKDYFFFPEDMAAVGTFALVKNSKTETGWTSDSDTDAAKTKDNFVELSFSAVAGTEYRCWVYAGGCCAETFAFAVQATELTGLPSKEVKDPVACEPGSAVFLPVKSPNLSLKKTHAAHNGPKGATRWDWIPIPLPKYGAGGPKQVRLLTNQQGFSIAYVVVSALKQGGPREGDVKALEKQRMETPGARPLNRGTAAAPVKKAPSSDQIVLYKVSVEGAVKPAALTQGTVDKAPDRPANPYCMAPDTATNGVSRFYLGDPNGFFKFEGEEIVSFDYWVDSTVTNVNFNLYDRTQQKNHSGAVDKLVIGKWTHFSVRAADLGGFEAAPLRTGDIVQGFYIQAHGGPARKFFLDNFQISKPRPRK